MKIWVKVKGAPGATQVPVADVLVVDDLLERVKQRVAPLLDTVSLALLQLYRSEAARQRGDTALRPGRALSDILAGNSDEDALYVDYDSPTSTAALDKKQAIEELGAEPLDAFEELGELAADAGSRGAPLYLPYVPVPAVSGLPGPACRDVRADDFDLNSCGRPDYGEQPNRFVDLDGCVQKCVVAVEENLPKKTQATNPRVPPVMLSRCMRGGKTTVLLKLFDKLRERGKNPIFISFNGDGIIPVPRSLTDETAMNTLIQCIAVALMKEKIGRPEAGLVRCSAHDIQNYLADKKNVVLLIDELNVLLRPGLDEYASVGRFLRTTFLDPAGRHLVFSTHVPLTAGIDVLLGKGIGSERSALGVLMPKSRSVSELRGMNEACQGLTPCEAAYYSYIPSLIFTVKVQPSYDFEQRFENIVAPAASDELRAAFLEEFFAGTRHDRSPLRCFDSLTEHFEKRQVRWVLGYAGLMCGYLGFEKVAEQIRDLTVHAKTVGSGKDWELITDIALCLRCYQAKYQEPHPLLGLSAGAEPEHVYVVTVPSEHTAPQDALTWWIHTGSRNVKYPNLAVLRPANASFTVFDSMLVFQHARGAPCEARGFQNKLSRDRPTKDAPEGMPGVLLRGDAPKTQSKPRVFERWQYPNKEQVLDFLGRSLQYVYPADWPETS